MNSDVIKGKWKQLTGKIKERWGDLTDDDLQAADGHAEYLVGKLQERYGWSKERPNRKFATSATACEQVERSPAGIARRGFFMGAGFSRRAGSGWR